MTLSRLALADFRNHAATALEDARGINVLVGPCLLYTSPSPRD